MNICNNFIYLYLYMKYLLFFISLCIGMQGQKGDIGYPGIGLPGWTGQKVT